jgi:hypothetical protein
MNNFMGDLGAYSRKAFEIAHQYRLLARELLIEKVRYEKFIAAPSRLSCIFLIESDIDIQKWKNEVIRDGYPYQIVEVVATGNAIRVDSKNLPKGTEPMSEWDLKACKYWSCDLTGDPCMEILFEGDVMVDKILETNFLQ